ncbi:hypothetical protein F4806DRAFT_494254 [Annulohypoxylon nitens]|nr:hypothetical protein F4806DRAFT_494254 [Annulohypoxylon nitens]
MRCESCGKERSPDAFKMISDSSARNSDADSETTVKVSPDPGNVQIISDATVAREIVETLLGWKYLYDGSLPKLPDDGEYEIDKYQSDEQVPVVVIETGFAHYIEAERAQQLMQTSNGLIKCVIFLNIEYVPKCGRLSALSRSPPSYISIPRLTVFSLKPAFISYKSIVNFVDEAWRDECSGFDSPKLEAEARDGSKQKSIG